LEYNYLRMLERRQLNGDHLHNRNYGQHCRYHLVMPSVPWKSLWIQDSVSCDNFRTPVIFEVLDNLVFVGDRIGSSINMDTTTSGIVDTFV